MKKMLTKINGSQTFYFKSRCKFCKSGPKYVYYLLNKMVTKDSFLKIKDLYENNIAMRIADDFYIKHSVKDRAFSPSYMFDSTSASLKKVSVPGMKYRQNADRFGTVVECNCGETSWAFVRSQREHIFNRKCPLNFNAKDVSSMYRIII